MTVTALNAASTRSKIIIGVDDAAENLLWLRNILKGAGYTFFGVQTGLECLSLLGRVTPRLILLDIEMPQADGFAICQKVRSNRELSHVPIAFLTVRKDAEDVKRGLAVGGNDFLVKPFDPVKLVERVRYWTSRTVGGSAMAAAQSAG